MKKNKLLNFILGTQITLLLLILFKFWYFSRFPSLEAPHKFTVSSNNSSRKAMLNSLTFLLAQSNNAALPDDQNIFHPGNGQSLWIIRDLQLTPQSPLLAIAKTRLEANTWELLKTETTDGVLNLLYDTGGPFEEFKSNLLKSLKSIFLSDLLPWQKRLDLVFLSGTSPQHSDSLKSLLYEKPTLCVFYPENTLKLDKPLPQNFIPLPPGLTLLGPGFYSLVLPDENGCNELELIITSPEGCAIVSGEGRAGFFRLIEETQKLTGKPVKYYLGGTNLLTGADNPELLSRLRKLKQQHPSLIIYSNYSTSLMAQGMLNEIFGDRYRTRRAGERCLINP